ncbi:hypothetical protein NDU88_001105 [Pleurodeles waltl]|uniref:Uncharacterized protein n=1 Tax=Pleurodeles waltl TaxID=8319 RepID=A0AAV7SYM1_PLEWA|nr:hypothetical protein NDU88_001105 [Pleurodeles waltl]
MKWRLPVLYAGTGGSKVTPPMMCIVAVSAHKKKGLWRAIAKDVLTLGVYGWRSTHCQKWWEDLRRWAQKTV